MDSHRFGEILAVGNRENAIDRVSEINRRRTDRTNSRDRRCKHFGLGMEARGECYAVRRKHADRRSSAHPERKDRFHHIIDGCCTLAHECFRKRSLIDKTDGIAVPPYRIHGTTIRHPAGNS